MSTAVDSIFFWNKRIKKKKSKVCSRLFSSMNGTERRKILASGKRSKTDIYILYAHCAWSVKVEALSFFKTACTVCLDARYTSIMYPRIRSSMDFKSKWLLYSDSQAPRRLIMRWTHILSAEVNPRPEIKWSLSIVSSLMEVLSYAYLRWASIAILSFSWLVVEHILFSSSIASAFNE